MTNSETPPKGDVAGDGQAPGSDIPDVSGSSVGRAPGNAVNGVLEAGGSNPSPIPPPVPSSPDATELVGRLYYAMIGSCNCVAKTHVAKMHEEGGRYRVLAEAADFIERL